LPKVDATTFNLILSTLSHPVRVQIVKMLSSKGSASFTSMMNGLNLNSSGRLSYHLKRLIKSGLTVQDQETGRYVLTEAGKILASIIEPIEDLSKHKHTRPPLVRTSELQLEPFNKDKIINDLKRETGMPSRIANEVASEVERKIMNMKIDYLTGPLIREIVVSTLLEKRFEDFRHKFTRLGMPYADAANLIEGPLKAPVSSPLHIQKRAAEALLEEYTLLSERTIGDAHISGAINLSHVHDWLLKLNTIRHDIRVFLVSAPESLPLQFSARKPQSLAEALRLLLNLITAAEAYLTSDQCIDYFNVFLAPYAKGLKYEEVKNLLREFIYTLNLNFEFKGFIPSVTINLELGIPNNLSNIPITLNGRGDAYAAFADEAELITEALLDVVMEGDILGRPFLSPSIVVKVRDDPLKLKQVYPVVEKIHQIAATWGIIAFANLTLPWQIGNVNYDAHFIRLDSKWHDDWELDSLRTGNIGEVAINVPRIAYEAKGSDDTLFTLLIHSLNAAIDALIVKQRRLLNKAKEGAFPLLCFNVAGKPYFNFESGSYNITLVGLPEAIKAHTGYFLHEDSSSLALAVKLVKLAASTIDERAKDAGVRFSLAQTVTEDPSTRFAIADSKRYPDKIRVYQGTPSNPYYTLSAPVPAAAQIPLKKRIRIEEALHKFSTGGHALHVWLNEPPPPPATLIRYTKKLCESNVGAFSYSRDLTYCPSCRKTYGGVKKRCLQCGSLPSSLTYYAREITTYKPLDYWSPAAKHEFKMRARYIL